MQVHRDIMDGRYRAAPFADAPATGLGLAAGARRGRRHRRRALLHRRRRGRQGRRPHRPLQRHRPPVPHRGARRRRPRRSLGEHAHQPGSGRPRLDPRPPLPRRPQRARRRRRRARRQVGRHRLQPAIEHHGHLHRIPTSSRPTTSAASIPTEVNEDAARAIGAAFVAYLKAKRIAVGRDMRLSSPVAGRGVHRRRHVAGRRRRRLRHDPDRHAVLRRGARSARRRRRDHRLAQSRSSTTA